MPLLLTYTYRHTHKCTGNHRPTLSDTQLTCATSSPSGEACEDVVPPKKVHSYKSSITISSSTVRVSDGIQQRTCVQKRQDKDNGTESSIGSIRALPFRPLFHPPPINTSLRPSIHRHQTVPVALPVTEHKTCQSILSKHI
jgi:hypothetical protein